MLLSSSLDPVSRWSWVSDLLLGAENDLDRALDRLEEVPATVYAPMEDWTGQAWSVAGLLGRRWLYGEMSRKPSCMERAWALYPPSETDPHTLGWVVAGLLRPSVPGQRGIVALAEQGDAETAAFRRLWDELEDNFFRMSLGERRAAEAAAAQALSEHVQHAFLAEVTSPERARRTWFQEAVGWLRCNTLPGERLRRLSDAEGAEGRLMAVACRIVVAVCGEVARYGIYADELANLLAEPSYLANRTPGPAHRRALAQAALALADSTTLNGLDLTKTSGRDEWAVRQAAALSLGLMVLEPLDDTALLHAAAEPVGAAVACLTEKLDSVHEALPFIERTNVAQVWTGFAQRARVLQSRLKALGYDAQWPPPQPGRMPRRL